MHRYYRFDSISYLLDAVVPSGHIVRRITSSIMDCYASTSTTCRDSRLKRRGQRVSCAAGRVL